jgi:hypothetical protein
MIGRDEDHEWTDNATILRFRLKEDENEDRGEDTNDAENEDEAGEVIARFHEQTAPPLPSIDDRIVLGKHRYNESSDEVVDETEEVGGGKFQVEDVYYQYDLITTEREDLEPIDQLYNFITITVSPMDEEEEKGNGG